MVDAEDHRVVLAIAENAIGEWGRGGNVPQFSDVKKLAFPLILDWGLLDSLVIYQNGRTRQ